MRLWPLSGRPRLSGQSSVIRGQRKRCGSVELALSQALLQ